MTEKLIECLTGIPRNDVPALCEMLLRIAKAVNPSLTDEAYVQAFGDFWATCFAFPSQPPMRGVQFMQAVCMPDLEFFNRLRVTLDIKLMAPAEPVAEEYNLRDSPAAKVSNLKLCVDVPDCKTAFRDLTPEEFDRVAYRGSQIKLRSLSGDVVSHDAPNGEFFTVRDLLRAIEKTERQTRDRSEWFGKIDVHHCYFEGIYLAADGVWDIAWGS